MHGLVKGIVHPKMTVLSTLLTLKFQTCMNFFLLLNEKKKIKEHR